MKIAVWYNLPSGGAKRALYDHVRSLVGRGHAVECWCPSTADRSYLPLSDLAPEHVHDLPWTPEGKGQFHISRAYGATRDRLRRMDRHCRECAEQINCGGFDLLFANPCRFFSSGAIARYVRVPAVLYLPDPFRKMYEALPKLPWVAMD